VAEQQHGRHPPTQPGAGQQQLHSPQALKAALVHMMMAQRHVVPHPHMPPGMYMGRPFPTAVASHSMQSAMARTMTPSGMGGGAAMGVGLGTGAVSGVGHGMLSAHHPQTSNQQRGSLETFGGVQMHDRLAGVLQGGRAVDEGMVGR
jgi:hypothetical protein